MSILTDNISSYKPQLHDILKYGLACGLEGERPTLMCGTIAFHGADLCCLITGPSQAGKTHLSKIVMSMIIPKAEGVDIVDDREVLFKEGGILQIEFGSKTAMAYQAEKLNEVTGIYVPEYQKAVDGGNNELVQEILKSYGEGRDAYRDVTQVGKQKTDTQRLKRSNWWACIATENPLAIDVETGNRVLPLNVDMSAEQTKRIMKFKARREFKSGRDVVMLPPEMLKFKHFMRRYRDTRDVKFENPFAEFIADHYLPSKYIKSRRAIDFYLYFNRAVCKWHWMNGERIETPEKGVLLNVEDIYQTEEIYGATCRFDMLQLDPNSLEIFNVFQRFQDQGGKGVLYHTDDRVMLDASTIHKELSKNGINLKLNVVGDMLDELQECGYLEYSTGVKRKDARFMVVDVEKPVQSVVDYKALYDHAKGLVSTAFPEQLPQWEAANMKDGKMLVVNPFTGEEVDLLKLEKPVKKEEPEPAVATGLDYYVKRESDFWDE